MYIRYINLHNFNSTKIVHYRLTNTIYVYKSKNTKETHIYVQDDYLKNEKNELLNFYTIIHNLRTSTACL